MCVCVGEHCVLCALLQLLNAIQLFGANLDDYLHLLLPPIVKLFDAPDVPLQARKSVPTRGFKKTRLFPDAGGATHRPGSRLKSEPFVLSGFYCLWRRVALETLDRLTESLDFTDYASRIIHPIVRTLDSTPELRSTSMDTLSSLVFQLGKKVAAIVLGLLFT